MEVKVKMEVHLLVVIEVKDHPPPSTWLRPPFLPHPATRSSVLASQERQHPLLWTLLTLMLALTLLQLALILVHRAAIGGKPPPPPLLQRPRRRSDEPHRPHGRGTVHDT